MTATYSLAEARGKLGALARRAARHERITLTDHGVPVAVLVSLSELEDLEDALAIARLERDLSLGRTGAPLPHDEARRILRAEHVDR
ncbi:type II toxin-antitoxin system prevent-host-death family antitoxin [Streptomyces verrucosisporus]|uniref:type II toxin-antitoxin system prevent-host-death family antitoxin n=1 Tax=Streptomyces verrucosisporus TaxID=1695161 RepID=UPI0019D15A72|nr:type II toxin-antitoxin system prevent-host-death family antitoxin [Streptomyces verrucosisporus]MBN3929162.1 type II toxin-antitoxin system prevent-host-death family antitoxin [Streptomyces verrucosisporus]